MSIIILKPEEADRRLLFCNNLRDLIRNGPIGAGEVSEKTGLSVPTIHGYMKGRVFPSDEKIEKLADALGVSVDDLFDDTYAPWKFGQVIDEE